VYLVRPRAGGTPRFVDLHTLRVGRFRRAYPEPDLGRVRGPGRRRRRPWE
jgi:hypothetical protein